MDKIIGIIGGKGKMGQQFVRFFEKNGFTVIVSDQRTKLTNRQLVEKADVVIVSVPMDKAESVIHEIAPHVRKSGLLMDFTSLKVCPMQAMKSTKASYLGCHPLFGPTNLMEGQVVILCPGRGKEWFDWLKNLLSKNRIIVRKLSAKKHDEMMAYVQVLSHFTDITFADALRNSGFKMKDFLNYQSPAYRLKLDMMGRILDQSANLYGNIHIQNPLNTKVIDGFLKSAETLSDLVQRKDLKSFENYFKKAANYLGNFRHAAMEESDRMIDNLIGSASVIPPSLLTGKEDIAILGPKNTYSDLALQSLYPNSKPYYATSITEVFELVENGRIKKGLVPLENSLTGSVRETLDELYSKKISISHVIKQPIHLALAGLKKVPLKSIEIIYSHPQPLLQSRQFIQKHCPKAITIPVGSTTEALRRIKGENNEHAVAIAAPIAVKANGLTIIRESIEDDHTNATTFALIGRNHLKSKTCSWPGSGIKNLKLNKTSIAFVFGKDSPGSLYTVLGDFANAGINLTKIESRPHPSVPGDYVFYADFEGSIDSKNVQKTLKNIEQKVAHLKLLGGY
ncbi:prephenate dehydratase [Candidatus Peregrinibacteria bacterium CG_4_10_14_0_2_um_filter_43_11]|nr:MAG: prephenate dehydratase [Candidatus Peregrinibacteria bacterium CG_4_10_14_0_2_um_filter_43_11]